MEGSKEAAESDPSSPDFEGDDGQAVELAMAEPADLKREAFRDTGPCKVTRARSLMW